MSNSRRFTSAHKKTAPTTPHGTHRVLPTPPTSATLAFRLTEGNANDVLHRNTEGVNSRSQIPAASPQSEVRPRLPLERFSKNKKPQPDSNGPGADSHGTNSPARQSRVQNVLESEHARPHRIFGQGNGLLPAISPPPPHLLARSIQQTASTHFSSPISSPGRDTASGNLGANAMGNSRDALDPSGPHTSSSSIFNQGQATSGLSEDEIIYRRTIQAHSSVRQGSMRGQTSLMDLQDEFEEPTTGSSSPTTYAKRRAGDHNAQVAAKRMRSSLNQGFDEDCYAPQEQETGILSAAPHGSQTLPRSYYSTSLEAYIEAHQTEWIAAQKRWEKCTIEEWQNGPGELTVELDKITDMVKKFMTKRMEVYAGINEDVDTHKARLDGRDALLAKEKERLIKQAGGLAGGFALS